MNGRMVPVALLSTGRDTQSPQYRRHPPQLHLTHAERGNPNEVWRMVDTASKLPVRKAELLSGKRKDQKAKGTNRKGTGIHNWVHRAKDGDTHAERWLT